MDEVFIPIKRAKTLWIVRDRMGFLLLQARTAYKCFSIDINFGGWFRIVFVAAKE
jgi:hypothetical protein